MPLTTFVLGIICCVCRRWCLKDGKEVREGGGLCQGRASALASQPRHAHRAEHIGNEYMHFASPHAEFVILYAMLYVVTLSCPHEGGSSDCGGGVGRARPLWRVGCEFNELSPQI
jgi:hypothetical protein